MDDAAEVIVAGPRPVAARQELAAAAARGARWVVVTDIPGRHPPAPPPSDAVMVTTRPVTEAMTVVAGGRVTISLERSILAEVVVPAVLETDTLARALVDAEGETVDLPMAVMAAGCRVMAGD